jgi:ornithine cyclodeaminase
VIASDLTVSDVRRAKRPNGVERAGPRSSERLSVPKSMPSSIPASFPPQGVIEGQLMTVERIESSELARLLPMAEAIASVRAAFRAHARREFDAPIRTSFHDGRMLVMSAFHRPTMTTAVKTVRIQPGRQPAIWGTVTWVDSVSGLLLDATELTALRTGAVVGVATDLLAPSTASHVVLIGAGSQAFDQVRAVLTVRQIERVTVVSRTLSSATSLSARIASAYPSVHLSSDTDPGPHLRSADIVCCATSSSTPVFDPSDLPQHVHINAIGAYTLSMQELPAAAMRGADVVVDDAAAVMSEAGDVSTAVTSGAIEVDNLSELGARLSHSSARSPRTVFKSVGLAIQDWAICRAVSVARLRHLGAPESGGGDTDPPPPGGF